MSIKRAANQQAGHSCFLGFFFHLLFLAWSGGGISAGRAGRRCLQSKVASQSDGKHFPTAVVCVSIRRLPGRNLLHLQRWSNIRRVCARTHRWHVRIFFFCHAVYFPWTAIFSFFRWLEVVFKELPKKEDASTSKGCFFFITKSARI